MSGSGRKLSPMDEPNDEILARLEALERRVAQLEGGEAPAGCSFVQEERRVVDLIVRLTAERVVEALDARARERGAGPPPPSGPPRGGPPPGGPPPPRRDR